MKKDKDVVLEAVKQNYHALYYASDELKRDKDVVLEVLKQDGDVFRFASDEIKKELGKNRDIVLEVWWSGMVMHCCLLHMSW
ncbi:DUF4116 domain-containing protein [Mycoplasmopsis cynos]|uniref:DUF4116 domain-containing protein n=1 Tax=Mycoplasmopsis cynos TaxID=171284 RepID=UPI0021FED2D8|nr:DUF4116 domain-containing protein [Mycoplasmopsis cynos]UWV77620.1 DUF4116 domain-containing protein [Mycoplasmopsis cynos]